MPLTASIQQLMRKQDLSQAHCQQALLAILEEETTPLQTAAFLVLLRAKTETAEELASLVTTLKQKMIPVISQHPVLDIVGTGGDGANTINISTGSAILAASCGVKIAKHGNRAVSSLAGSADVLEALGVNINLRPEKISACIDEIGIGFCFSPNFHPAMQQLRKLRRELQVATTFNILGPLLNPSNPQHILLGVYDAALLPIMAESLKKMGTTRSIVAYGAGLDEISCAGTTKLMEITASSIQESSIHPQQLGLATCSITALQGADAQTNAQLLLQIFQGKISHTAIADTLVMNTAVALYLYGIHNSIAAGIPHAQENLANGKALTLLNNWIAFSHD